MSQLLAINNYHYLRGGSEVVFFGHNRLLEERGWEVVPFSMQHPDNMPTYWSRWFIENSDFDPKSSVSRKIKQITRVVYSLEARSKIQQLLEHISPDICHIHNIYHHISPSILPVLYGRGIPVVMTLHDLKLACPAYSMLSGGKICERCKGGRTYNLLRYRCIKNSLALSGVVFIERITHDILRSYCKYINRFVVPSRFLLDKLVEWGWRRESFSYVPNFIDSSLFLPRFEPGRRFVYFGRLSPEKGVSLLIQAACRARVALTIIGTGPEDARLREIADKQGGDVEFLGHLSGACLRESVARARAVVVPSTCYENAPMAVMEAYSLGKPVLAANIGGIPELVREETGATFPVGSVDALAELLARFSELPASLLEQMGHSGREWMKRDFSPQKYRYRVMDIYRALGAGSGCR